MQCFDISFLTATAPTVAVCHLAYKSRYVRNFDTLNASLNILCIVMTF